MSSAAAPRSIAIAADHGGFVLKEQLKEYFAAKHTADVRVVDVGCFSADRVDYPDIAKLLCAEVLASRAELGIVVCGTGIGISIACNKIEGIRCALAHDHYTARMAREHNDANVLSLGGRTTGIEVAFEIVDTFLATPFAGAHHAARVAKLSSAYLC